MASRYTRRTFIQPTRKISIANTDVYHTFNQFDNVDALADKWYHDVTLGWVIMCANPQYKFEFQINPGDKIRIAFPINRIWNEWGYNNEV